MHDKPNPRIVESWYKAFLAGDAKAIESIVASDFEWQVGGDSPVSGTYRGPQGILDLRAKLGDLTRNSFRAWKDDSWDVAVSDVHAVVLDRWVAERNGRKLDSHVALVVVIENGKVCLAFTYFTDQPAFGGFWK